MKQTNTTAVEWLIQNLYKQEPKYVNGKLDIDLYKEERKQMFEEAKLREREQTKLAYLLGVEIEREEEYCPDCEGVGCAECGIIEQEQE